jgi:hypothetical protein
VKGAWGRLDKEPPEQQYAQYHDDSDDDDFNQAHEKFLAG